MSKFQHILEPLWIKNMELRNRVVMPPITTMLANHDHSVSEANIAYIKRIAGSGAGLIITEATAVRRDGINGPGMLGIYEDRFIGGLSRLSSEVHKQGSKVMVQIHHVGRESRYQLEQGRAIAPSAAAGVIKKIPREMNRDDINQVVCSFGQAAVRARAAGFDGVELHAAHGYLLMQFLSRFSNYRDDEYGGDFKTRSRFILEVIKEVRKQVGDDFPISLRISAEEYVPGGYTIDDMLEIVPFFVEAGIDILHTSFGTQASPGSIVCPSVEYRQGFNSHLASKIKSAVDIPVITVGRFSSLSVAEKTLARGEADLVAFGRQHLADPDFLRNALEGKEKETIECLACNQGCIERLYQGKSIRCAINPITGQELIYTEKKAGIRYKVLVIGAGPAGLTAAIQAAQLGHSVVLVEKEGVTGGQVRLAARAPSKDVYERWIDQLTERAEKAGIDIRLSQEADVNYVKNEAPEVVILAAGSITKFPPVPGIESLQVVDARQVLRGNVDICEHIVIIGGGLVGMETADYLRAQGIKDVIIVETSPRSPVKESNGHGYMLHRRFNEVGYKLWLETRVLEIKSGKIKVESAGEEKVIEPVGQVIVATGSSSCNMIKNALEQEDIRFFIVGDAYKPRRILEAVAEGAEAAWSI